MAVLTENEDYLAALARLAALKDMCQGQEKQKGAHPPTGIPGSFGNVALKDTCQISPDLPHASQITRGRKIPPKPPCP